jgi:hypothetical protein
MNKLLSIFIVLIIFGSAASAAEISGKVISDGKKLDGLYVTLSKVNGTTQNDQSTIGVSYNFIPLSDTTTDKDGNYVFNDLNNGMYRVNVTYNGITYGENIGLQGKAVVDFNLSGKIDGFVLKANKTVEGIPVRLLDTSGIELMNTNTNKNGKYSFNKVNSGKSYFIETTYADVPYTKPVNTSESADFIVYEPTKDGTVISVNIDHIVLSKASNGIKVDEFVEFINTGDKVFFSKDRVWLGIWTPDRDVTRFQTDVIECCLQREKDTARIDPMRPILPGDTYTAQISYVFNPESSKNLFYKGIIYNTSYITLLSEKNNGFGIESKYAKKEIVPREGKEFEVLSFLNVPKDQRLDIQIPGYVPSKISSGGDFNYLILVLALVLVGAVSYPFVRGRMAQKTRRRIIKPAPSAQVSTDEPQEAAEGIPQTDVAPEDVSGKDITEMSFDELRAEKNAAFESILALDNEFNTGKIPEKEYKELKKEQKENAMLVIKQLKDAASNLDLGQPVPILEKIISHVDDIDILEDMLEREKEGENRDELKKIIEERIENIEQNE